MIRRSLQVALFTAGLVTSSASVAGAQTLGVFRWQMQPYCNVVTLTVEQKATGYVLTGLDNLCGGGAPVATAAGVAAVNPNGTIALGLTIVTSTGATAHLNATLSLTSVSGPWRDADGNTGTLVFEPGILPGLPQRPAPRSFGTLVVTGGQVAPGAIGTQALAAQSVTADKLAPSAFAGTGAQPTLARSDHHHDTRYYTQAFLDSRPSSAIAAMGLVHSNGTLQFKASGTNVTVARLSPGTYRITLLGHDPGCTNKFAVPLATAGQCCGRTASAIFNGATDCPTGDTQVYVQTYNGSTLTDTQFQFIVFSGRE
jgi:hypothetical protein